MNGMRGCADGSRLVQAAKQNEPESGAMKKTTSFQSIMSGLKDPGGSRKSCIRRMGSFRRFPSG